MHAGADAVTAADIDPFAAVAIGLNARANGHRVSVVARDVLDEPPPDADVVLAGDCWYEAALAQAVLPRLGRSGPPPPPAAPCRRSPSRRSPHTRSGRRPSSRTSR